MFLLVFAAALLLAVLVSELADRSVLSTAVLFLVVGFVAGSGVTDLIDFDTGDPLVREIAEIALFAVLFTDGMRTGIRDLTSAWRLPGRALLLGMPLTIGVIAVFAHFVAGLTWLEATLVAAVLSPTDPVFAAAIVGRQGVPQRLRRLLNVESGLNDGIALPVVIILLALLERETPHTGALAFELAAGAVLGIVIPWVALRLERSRYFSPDPGLAALFPFAIGLLVFALARLTHANLFLAAFAAGITLQSVSPEVAKSFHRFGELVSELLKLLAILLFAALMSPQFLAEIPPSGYLFAALTLLVARPVAIGIALLGARVSAREWVAAAWFGPKGFASVVLGLLVARSEVPSADAMFHLIALVVAASIIVHSSTDVVVAAQFRDLDGDADAPQKAAVPDGY